LTFGSAPITFARVSSRSTIFSSSFRSVHVSPFARASACARRCSVSAESHAVQYLGSPRFPFMQT
jgi:hypothetical protein